MRRTRAAPWRNLANVLWTPFQRHSSATTPRRASRWRMRRSAAPGSSQLSSSGHVRPRRCGAAPRQGRFLATAVQDVWRCWMGANFRFVAVDVECSRGRLGRSVQCSFTRHSTAARRSSHVARRIRGRRAQRHGPQRQRTYDGGRNLDAVDTAAHDMDALKYGPQAVGVVLVYALRQLRLSSKGKALR